MSPWNWLYASLYQIDYPVWYVNKKIWKIEPFFEHTHQKIYYLDKDSWKQVLIFSLLLRASWYIPKDYSQPVGTWYSPRNHRKTCQHIFLCEEEKLATVFLWNFATNSFFMCYFATNVFLPLYNVNLNQCKFY